MMTAIEPQKTLSPRQLAEAIGVSESSVKRWIDAGKVPARVTTGGHRRVEVMDALRFLRESGRTLHEPGALGFTSRAEDVLARPEDIEDELFELLVAGKTREVSELAAAAFSTRMTDPAKFFDGPVRTAMARVRERRNGGPDSAVEEQRATSTMLRVIDEIRALFETPDESILGLGGSFERESSLLPARMAATVIASEGIFPVDLGADVSVPAFLGAVRQTGARLVWLSVGCAAEPALLKTRIEQLAAELRSRGVHLIVGGREVEGLGLDSAQIKFGSTMEDLARWARGVVRDEAE